MVDSLVPAIRAKNQGMNNFKDYLKFTSAAAAFDHLNRVLLFLTDVTAATSSDLLLLLCVFISYIASLISSYVES